MKEQKQSKQAFTLVELIVVITILAILGTIAIMAFSGYSKNARDSARIADITNMKKSLELWILQSGTYPQPSNGINITYSGATVWTEGKFGDSVTSTVGKLEKKPVDPLYEIEYTYSITNSKKEYQIGAVLEKDMAIGVINQTYAATSGEAYVTGTYNGIVTSTQTGGIYYILAVPSIILSDINNVNLLETQQFVMNGESNIPYSYAEKNLIMTGSEVDFTPIVVWSGTGYTNLNNQVEFQNLVTNLQTAYTDPLFATLPEYSTIVTDAGLTSTVLGSAKTIIEAAISTQLTNVSTTVAIDPAPQFLANCSGNGQIYYTDNTGVKIAQVSNTGATISGNPSSLACNGHIIVCSNSNTGYVIQPCNIGVTTVGTGSVSYGKFFQWGENIAWDASVGITASNNCTWDRDNQTCTIPSLSSWTSSVSDTTNGTSDRWYDYGDTRGPCSVGYHVPSQSEWSGLIVAGGWSSIPTFKGVALRDSLRLPFSGFRSFSDGTYFSESTNAYYWSSTPHATNGYSYILSSNTNSSASINPANYSIHGQGLNLRCLKTN